MRISETQALMMSVPFPSRFPYVLFLRQPVLGVAAADETEDSAQRRWPSSPVEMGNLRNSTYLRTRLSSTPRLISSISSLAEHKRPQT